MRTTRSSSMPRRRLRNPQPSDLAAQITPLTHSHSSRNIPHYPNTSIQTQEGRRRVIRPKYEGRNAQPPLDSHSRLAPPASGADGVYAIPPSANLLLPLPTPETRQNPSRATPRRRAPPLPRSSPLLLLLPHGVRVALGGRAAARAGGAAGGRGRAGGGRAGAQGLRRAGRRGRRR